MMCRSGGSGIELGGDLHGNFSRNLRMSFQKSGDIGQVFEFLAGSAQGLFVRRNLALERVLQTRDTHPYSVNFGGDRPMIHSQAADHAPGDFPLLQRSDQPGDVFRASHRLPIVELPQGHPEKISRGRVCVCG